MNLNSLMNLYSKNTNLKRTNHASTRNRLPHLRTICRNRTGSTRNVIAEAGSFMMMDNNIQMETILAMVPDRKRLFKL
jgi:hypothetical protein